MLVSLHANLTPPNAVVFELDHPYMVASKRSCIQQPQQSLQQPRQPQWQPRKQRQHQRPDNNDEVSKVPGETHVKVLSVVCEAHFHVSSFLFPSTSRGCWGWRGQGLGGGIVRSKVFAKNRSIDFYGKVHIFWEGHKIVQNLHQLFDWQYIGQIISRDFAKLCGLLRIYEL